MSAQNDGSSFYTVKPRAKLKWERDRTRLQTEARLFMNEVLNTALWELDNERGTFGAPLDETVEFLIVKHIIGALCEPDRSQIVQDAAKAVSVDLTTSKDAIQALRGAAEIKVLEK